MRNFNKLLIIGCIRNKFRSNHISDSRATSSSQDFIGRRRPTLTFDL